VTKPLNLTRSRYKWLGKWAARELKPGVAFQAFRGKDYECLSISFAGQVYAAAYALGLKATCSVFEDCVVFAFYHPDAFMRPNMPAYPVVRKMRSQ
jgi:hypothetical protein